jgi:hypothetical protein
MGETMDFSDALRSLKRGNRIARRGWNGRGMWLVLIKPGAATFRGYDMQPCIGLKTAGGEMQPGWLATQADLLAEDWVEVTDA